VVVFSAAAIVVTGYLQYRKSKFSGYSVKKTRKTLRIGTRKSDLAMVQTHYVADLLRKAYPELDIQILKGIDAVGDKDQVNSLKKLAKKIPGLFSKDLEEGLVENVYDAAVHSLKDMPTTLPDKLVLAAITEREDPRDALIVRAEHKGKGGLRGLPKGAVIGTSSVRREAFLRRDFDHFKIKVIRGNVNTRLRKLDDGEYDAIVLAVAGLKRLGKEFENRIEEYLEPPHFLYGVGQGCLGLQCREDDEDIIKILQSAEHWESSARCRCERALLKLMEAGCQVPLGVHSEIRNNNGRCILSLACTVLTEDGKTSIHATMLGDPEEPEELGRKLAKKILLDGGKAILDGVNGSDFEQVNVRPLTYGSAENPNLQARGSILKK